MWDHDSLEYIQRVFNIGLQSINYNYFYSAFLALAIQIGFIYIWHLLHFRCRYRWRDRILNFHCFKQTKNEFIEFLICWLCDYVNIYTNMTPLTQLTFLWGVTYYWGVSRWSNCCLFICNYKGPFNYSFSHSINRDTENYTMLADVEW